VFRVFLLAGVTLVAVLAAPSSAFAVTCADFTNQAAAQFAGNTRDGDGDGVYCEALPCPCSKAPPGTPAAPLPVVSPEPGPSPAPEPASAPLPNRTAVRIERVVDGDTLKVRLRDGRRRTVRLIGIDTPESVKPGVRVECGGKAATATMVKLAMQRRRGRLVGRNATLVSDPSQGATDRFGRTLAYVESGGRDLGRAIVRAGLAAVYVYSQPFARLAAYQAAGNAAKGAAAGVWRTCGGDFHSAQ
jgi:micrococcal nuclease